VPSEPDPAKHWQRIDRLLDEALAREPARRQAFLEQACADDSALRQEVETLLAAHDQASHFMEKPALELGSQTLKPTENQSLVGRRLGPYEILSLLGRGGMGEVYRARDTRLDRFAALKILPFEVAGDPERLRRFVREAKAASALNHPNIATIYDIGESDGIHWIAMELVEGETLAEQLSWKKLEIAAIIDIAVQAAEALEEAHSKGITHRDIKPANLMLTPKEKVKVLDFGLAKITRQEELATANAASETHTFPGLVMGTARYMSPEQILGQEVDHRTDLFSMGVVLYEMVTGRQDSQDKLRQPCSTPSFTRLRPRRSS
jgi:eukaryotic-like serine/threonine-protein kinase